MKGGLPTWFAVPGGVRGLHRAIATAKSRYTKVARPATAKATVSSTTKFSMINFEKSHTTSRPNLAHAGPLRIQVSDLTGTCTKFSSSTK